MAVENDTLCTLDEVKNFIGMTGSRQLDDDLIEDLCDRVTVIFERHCGRESFKDQSYTEFYDGENSEHLFVNNVPIVSVTSIHNDTEWVWGTDTLLDAANYRIVDGKYIVFKSERIAKSDQSIKISYVAGYESIPKDLKQVAIEEAARRYKHRKDFDVISKTLSDGTSDYAPPGLLRSTVGVLNFYRLNSIY
jgi:hypothetical protein